MQPYIGNDGDVCDELHDGKPDADVLSSLNHRAAILSHKLLSVQSDLHPVVDESKERRQRASRHKNGNEAKLDHCWRTRGGRLSRRPTAAGGPVRVQVSAGTDPSPGIH